MNSTDLWGDFFDERGRECFCVYVLGRGKREKILRNTPKFVNKLFMELINKKEKEKNWKTKEKVRNKSLTVRKKQGNE
jgi:hypothetical protein